jgi:hypothetical protein
MSLVIDEHRQYLADTNRISAFDRAIRETVRPGDVVVDLGSGTGILGLLACRAGASRVYSIDEGPIVGLARNICEANGYADRMVFLRDVSTRLTIPEPADVLVTDQIGRFGFEAGLVGFVRDARRRLLTADARVVPGAVSLVVAPVEAEEQWDAVAFWKRPVAGLDVSAVWPSAVSTGYPLHVSPGQLLAAPFTIARLPLSDGAARLAGSSRHVVARAGTLHGIAGWFDARLSPSVTMTNSPLDAGRINRRQILFPIDRPVHVEPGDAIAVAMTILSNDQIVTWKVEVQRAGAAAPLTFNGSTFQGMLISSEDTARTRPAFVPALTAAGRGRRTVLELCDGRHDLASIEREVFTRHQDLFATEGEAAAFVAEVVTRYADTA